MVVSQWVCLEMNTPPAFGKVFYASGITTTG
jgi:hypothetical protein